MQKLALTVSGGIMESKRYQGR